MAALLTLPPYRGEQRVPERGVGVLPARSGVDLEQTPPRRLPDVMQTTALYKIGHPGACALFATMVGTAIESVLSDRARPIQGVVLTSSRQRNAPQGVAHPRARLVELVAQSLRGRHPELHVGIATFAYSYGTGAGTTYTGLKTARERARFFDEHRKPEIVGWPSFPSQRGENLLVTTDDVLGTGVTAATEIFLAQQAGYPFSDVLAATAIRSNMESRPTGFEEALHLVFADAVRDHPPEVAKVYDLVAADAGPHEKWFTYWKTMYEAEPNSFEAFLRSLHPDTLRGAARAYGVPADEGTPSEVASRILQSVATR